MSGLKVASGHLNLLHLSGFGELGSSQETGEARSWLGQIFPWA